MSTPNGQEPIRNNFLTAPQRKELALQKLHEHIINKIDVQINQASQNHGFSIYCHLEESERNDTFIDYVTNYYQQKGYQIEPRKCSGDTLCEAWFCYILCCCSNPKPKPDTLIISWK